MKKKIKQDKHGLYIRTNGSIYRPQLSVIHSHQCTSDMDRGDNTEFKNKQEVNAHHISQTPWASLEFEGHKEVWYSHGNYFSPPKGIKTEDCWFPKNIENAKIEKGE